MSMQLSRTYLLVLLLLLNALNAFSTNELSVKTLDNHIVVDGIVDPQEWQLADSINGFFQLEPEKGQPASRVTKMLAGQHKGNLYFAFVCFINNPGEIAARIQRRDQLDESDDIVALLLDTYNDKRTSLLFMVNALGTLTDAKVTDDGKNTDTFWDTEWEAKTFQSEEYWSVEISIPYEKIQYNSDSEIWGANFGRVIRANQETSWWTPVTQNFRISQSGQLVGIKPGGKQKHQVRLFPYGTARYENSDVTGVYKKVDGAAGMDVLYQYGSNVVANLTFNPDFATVEGDKEQINLTPWELRFPDKRLFFQDGNEMFQTRISTFYSRRIGDMQYGGKAIGKAGKYQFNALTARTEEIKDGAEIVQPGAWFNAVRVKRDILQSSILGMTYADKVTDSTAIRSYSMDYVLNLGKTWKLTGQYVASTPGDFLDHSAWFVRFARENNVYHYHFRYSNIGRNFQDNVNQTGFITDDDRHEIDGDIKYRFWINKKIKYIYTEGKHNVFWSQDGDLRSWFLTYRGRMYFTNRFSFEATYNNEFQNEFKGEIKDFHNHFFKGELGFNTDEASNIKVGYQAGHNFDRDFQLWLASFRVQVLKKLTLTYEFNWLDYKPDPTNVSTAINVLGADFFFNKDLWIRVFTQNNTASDKYYFYGLFGWRFKPPFGAAYIIFSADQFKEVPSPEKIRSDIIFLKLTYPISIL